MYALPVYCLLTASVFFLLWALVLVVRRCAVAIEGIKSELGRLVRALEDE